MELIIEGLKSYHNSKFIDDMISFNNENNEIYFIDDGKTAIIKVSVLLNNRFAGLLGRLEFNCPRSYYYDDDDLDNYWTMTKTQATNQEIIDKLNDKIIFELAKNIFDKYKKNKELEFSNVLLIIKQLKILKYNKNNH